MERRDISPRPTSHDVARIAGVSRSTVNEILNGRGARFPPATQGKVQRAVEELGYTPSPAARGLKIGRSDTVLLLLPGGALSPTFLDLVDEVGAAMQTRGLHVVVQFGRGDRRDVVNTIRRLAPVAVLNLGGLDAAEADALEAAGTAVVPARAPSTRANFEHAVGEALFATLRNSPGTSHYLYVEAQDALHHPANDDRFEGMNTAALAAGLAPPPRIALQLNAPLAAQTLKEHLRSDAKTGIACQTDAIAFAALAACRELRLDVPGRVAIIGVDAGVEGQLASPRLTSVRLNYQALGRLLASELGHALGDSSSEDPLGPPLEVIIGETT